jgi:DNA adenine methylase
MKWVGGKGKLLDQLLVHFPDGPLRYGEAFLGGGAVFFHLASADRLQSAVLTDLSRDVVNVHSCVRDQQTALLRELARHEAAYLQADADGRAAYFYAMRARQPGLVAMTAVERAARMLFLNRTCFNGLWRENSRGEFNSPHGRYSQPGIVQEAKITAASAALQQATVLRADFREWPQLVRTHGLDFVYLDPPYHPLNPTSSFNAYSGGSFTARAQAELAEVCAELDAMDVRWVLSNSDCPLIRSLYGRWQIATLQAPRAINVRADRRGAVAEVVVSNRRPGLRW